MYFVYLLVGENRTIYVGYTASIELRFHQHLAGRVYTSRKMGKLRLYYYEVYESKELAQLREKNLKKYGSAYQGLLRRIGLK